MTVICDVETPKPGRYAAMVTFGHPRNKQRLSVLVKLVDAEMQYTWFNDANLLLPVPITEAEAHELARSYCTDRGDWMKAAAALGLAS